MASEEDKRAAKVLEELGLVEEGEARELLEAVDEIEPEGGLLGLLEEDGRLSAGELRRVRRKMSKAAGGTTIRPRDLKGGTRVRRRPAEEAEGDAGAEPARKGSGSRRRASERVDAPKGKGKLFAAMGVVAVLAAGAVVAVLVLGGGAKEGGGSDDGTADAGTGETGPSGDRPADASGKEPGGTPGAATGGERQPAIPATTLRYKFSAGLRIIHQSEAQVNDKTPDRRFKSTRGVTEIIDCLGETSTGGDQKVGIEKQVTESLQRENKPPENPVTPRQFDFLVLTPEGEARSEGTQGADDLLWVLASPIFPPGGRVEAGKWSMERESKMGRFDVRYRIEDLSEPVKGEGGEPRPCVRIAVAADFPGGAPPAPYRLDRAKGTIWFDPAAGVVAKAEAFLDTSPANAPEGDESLVTRSLSSKLLSTYEVDSREGAELQAAAELFFGVLDMMENRQYAKAIKSVDTADLSAKYCPILPDLKAMIPEVRMSLQAGAAMRDRKPQAYRNLPWRRPDRPPAMLERDAPRRSGSRHPQDFTGKSAPEWLREHCQGGKASFVYFAMAPFDSCRSVTRFANQLGGEYRGAVGIAGVLLESEQQKLWEYMMSLGSPIGHRIQVDPKMKAVVDGKIEGVPALFVVDGSGTVRYSEVGWFGKETEDEVKAALSKYK